ncbi:Uncharacterised protein [Candidatus Tiddalikarchaeum anstoanum]|nr:Uncharacterised protein [Candidatus Tiddalikarchaeum anstoanum]
MTDHQRFGFWKIEEGIKCGEKGFPSSPVNTWPVKYESIDNSINFAVLGHYVGDLQNIQSEYKTLDLNFCYSRLNGKKIIYSKGKLINEDEQASLDYWNRNFTDCIYFPRDIYLQIVSDRFDFNLLSSCFQNWFLPNEVPLDSNYYVNNSMLKIIKQQFDIHLNTALEQYKKSTLVKQHITDKNLDKPYKPNLEVILDESIDDAMFNIVDMLCDQHNFNGFNLPSVPFLSFQYELENNQIRINKDSFKGPKGSPRVNPILKEKMIAIANFVRNETFSLYVSCNELTENLAFQPFFCGFSDELFKYIMYFDSGTCYIKKIMPQMEKRSNLDLLKVFGGDI